jgi:predicted dehydrogenase
MSTRRTFLKSAAAGAVLTNLPVPGTHGAGSDVIKVGVVGCGGRGSGAAENIVDSTNGVKITAVGDVFKHRAERLRNFLSKERPDKAEIADDRVFVGIDAYKKVIDSGIDLVVLATPPGFRPRHIEYAVAAGKNIFTEKPVAVDAPGIRRCLAAYEESRKKNLGIVAGTQRRHQTGYLETMQRLHDGAIGEITGGRCYWNQGAIWFRSRDELKRFAEKPGDVAYQMHNWYHFVWTCGDHFVEQHVHNLDVINWALRALPVRCVGLGGRSNRPAGDPAVVGNIFDHFAVDYEYPNGVHILSMARQIAGTKSNVSEAVVGTKGTCQVNAYTIRGEKAWRFGGRDNAPYVQEHTDLIKSIRDGRPLNELKTVAESTLTAIMGRMSTYTGQEIGWEQALNSKQDTFPKDLSWDAKLDTPPVAMPGKTPFL